MRRKHRYGGGRVFLPTYTYKGELRTSTVYAIAYYVGKKEKRESAKTTSWKDANDLLNKRLTEVASGQLTADASRTTVAQLLDLVIDDYRKQGRGDKAVKDQERHKAALCAYFGADAKASTLNSAKIAKFQSDSLSSKNKRGRKFAPATINRQLACLRRGFVLGRKYGLVTMLPAFENLEENNARKGFLEREQFDGLLKQMPEHYKPLMEIAYITGWRIHSELLTRKWLHAKLTEDGWLRLDPGEAKNGEGREFAMTAWLLDALKRQRAYVRSIEKKKGRVIPWMFILPHGVPVQSFRKTWKKAIKAAKISNIPHDFRRTAVRNLIQAGVDKFTAMQMVGHKTDNVFKRYAIIDAAMARRGAAKLAEFHDTERRALEKTT